MAWRAGLLGGGRHRLGRWFAARLPPRQQAERGAHAAFEFVRQPGHEALLLRLALLLHLVLRLAQAVLLDEVVLEDPQAARDAADLVAALDERNVHREVAARQPIHHAAGQRERPRQTAPDAERDEPGGHPFPARPPPAIQAVERNTAASMSST